MCTHCLLAGCPSISRCAAPHKLLLHCPTSFPLPPLPLLSSPQLDNPGIFPQRFGGSFPPSFAATVRNILKRLFRVYGHIYHSHFR
jgi:hypothetical protein